VSTREQGVGLALAPRKKPRELVTDEANGEKFVSVRLLIEDAYHCFSSSSETVFNPDEDSGTAMVLYRCEKDTDNHSSTLNFSVAEKLKRIGFSAALGNVAEDK
jgi:hypothetical protein